MDKINTEILYKYLRDSFEEYFQTYNAKIFRESYSLSLSKGPGEILDQPMEIYNRKWAFLRYAELVINICRSSDISSECLPKDKDYYSELEIVKFFHSETVLQNDTKVKKVVDLVHNAHMMIADHISHPYDSLMHAQYELIQRFVQSIDQRNEVELKRIQEKSRDYFLNSFSQNKRKLSKVDNNSFLTASQFVKSKLVSSGLEVSEGNFEKEMGLLFESASRGNIRVQVKKRFGKEFQEWRDDL